MSFQLQDTLRGSRALRVGLLFGLYLLVAWTAWFVGGPRGLLGDRLPVPTLPWLAGYGLVVGHVTIAAMSLSFHRAHAHRGLALNRWVDGCMQVWLWLLTSMTKLDWVSVHRRHHACSDTKEDPHSPKQRGFWRIFVLGALDYARAKHDPAVRRLRTSIPMTPLETFLCRHPLLGPAGLSMALLLFLGPAAGSVLMALHFSIGPLLAIGGVNALAHTVGYRNFDCPDNSRNIGFLLPLNLLLCGELDHNNHHAYPASCSFRHRWFELDIGWLYIRVLAAMGLAGVHHVHGRRRATRGFSSRARTPRTR